MRFHVAVGGIRAERLRGSLYGWRIRVDAEYGENLGFIAKHGRNRYTGRFNYEQLHWYTGRTLSAVLRRMAVSRGAAEDTLTVRTGTEPVPAVIRKVRKQVLSMLAERKHCQSADDLLVTAATPQRRLWKAVPHVFRDAFEDLHAMGFIGTDPLVGGYRLTANGMEKVKP